MKALPCAVLSACLIGTVVETAPQSVSFAKPIHSPLTDQPIVGTAAADLNRDGRPDLVVA